MDGVQPLAEYHITLEISSMAVFFGLTSEHVGSHKYDQRPNAGDWYRQLRAEALPEY